MKKSVLNINSVCLFMIVFIAVFFVAQLAVSAEGGLTKITDDVYSYVDVKKASPTNSFGANSGIIIGQEGIVVVDTLMTAKEAKRFIKDIRAVSDKPIRHVIDTHYHLDHAFGNGEFAKQGAVIISHEKDREDLQKKGGPTLKSHKDFGISKDAIEGTEIALPALTYNGTMTIHLGNMSVVLIHPGPAHTQGDTMVYIPEKKVLFTGDILFTNFHPFLGEGDLTSWANVLDTIVTMDVEKIIPGHGPLSTKKDVETMKSYLAVFNGKAKELCARSNDIKYIVAEMMKVLPAREGGDFLIGSNIQMRCRIK